nr:snRNA-activating protein complex subunit 4 isoform X2 [Scatophagus argus]XP_046242392.1 snRNA-activating protein complex subunit 4 isoform X2 [Scatophagus argus]
MSVSLSAERDRIQRQVEQLEQSLAVTHTELELLSSETEDESDGDDTEEGAGQSAAGLLAQREKIQKEIQNLENVLGPHSSTCVSDDDSSSSEESELGLSLSVDSCIQMNLVYQQVVQETLDQLEMLLTHNRKQQKEVVSQLSGPIREPLREQLPPSSCQPSVNLFLGRFLKPYFKDKLTGLGPPANQETKEKASRMTGCLDNKKLKVKRWESWQKTLLIHSVARDGLRRLTQPKLSKVDYLSQKLSSAVETDRQQLREQIDSLEREISLLRKKKEEELIGDRYEEHDWQKISNIDFEGTRDADDIRSFWQNFLHPSINKTRWSQEEVEKLKEVSRRHGERHWETIAAELGTGRTAFLCLQTFQRFVSDSLRHGSWTPAEDTLLRELVDKMRIGNFIPYTQMSYFMEGRDPAQLIYRWNQVLDPSLKKGPWTQEEDQLLLRAVSRYGEKDWWKIRLEVPGRHDSACRDRYYDCLKADTKRGPFDKQEKELLLKLVEKHGVGRWAKIAAEIPHRNDAQCLREWRRLSRPPPSQKDPEAKKVSCRGAKKKVTPAKKTIRRRQVKVKEEEISEEEEEEEDMVVEYMDSDEEPKKKKKKKEMKEVVEVLRTGEVEKEEEEEEYTFPPMQEWAPAEKAESFTLLSFRPVELPSSGDAHKGIPFRSTILGQLGRSEIIGPPPRELQWERRHSTSTLMMVSPDQLRAHLCRQVDKYNNLSSRPQEKVQSGKQNHLSRARDKVLDYELQVAVLPWIGNLLIPAKTRLTIADALREQGEKTRLSSTPVFTLLLQTMNVDSVGCKEMIEQRRNRVMLLTPPVDPSPVRMKSPKTIAGILQRRKVQEEHQGLDQQHKLILNQIQFLRQHEKQKQLLLKQQLRPQQPQQLMLLQQPPLPRLPSMPSQNRREFLLQMPPVSFPQAVLIPQPIAQSQAASNQLMPPSSLTVPPPAPHRPAALTSPLPAPTRPTVLPVSAVPVALNATSPFVASFHQQAGSLTQNLDPCPALSPSSSTPNPPKRGRRKVSEDPQAYCSGPNEVEGNGAGGECTGLDRAGDGGSEEGRRTRKPTVKAKTLREATDARAEAKKKAAASPRKEAQIQTTNTPPQSVIPVPSPVASIQLTPPQAPQLTTPPAPPPSAVIFSPLLKAGTASPPRLSLDVPAVSTTLSKMTQNATPACSDTTMSSTQNCGSGPPSSVWTNQHRASFASSLPVPFHNDHDYVSLNLGPTPSPHVSESVQVGAIPKNICCESDPVTVKPSRVLPRGTKRVRVEEQTNVTGSQNDQSGTGTGVTPEGKRVRKPSQRARALQEAAQAKVEAKKKRTSSPCKKRSRMSHSKEEVVVQNQTVTPQPGFCLHPGQSMWAMTSGGLVQLAEAPPLGMQLALVPSPDPHQSVTPPLQLKAGSPQTVLPKPTAVSVPVNVPGDNQPHPLHVLPTSPSKSLPPTIILQPVPNPVSSPLANSQPQPAPKLFMPYKGTVRTDPAAPPPLRREGLQFDPLLMFQESRAAVCDWLSGRGGVVVPGADVSLPYLPPFVSSLNSLSALLRAQKSLTKSSLQLLSRGSKPRHPQTQPRPDSSTPGTSSQPPDQPDSTSDLSPAVDKPAPSVSCDLPQEEAEEAELVAAVRQLVAERFSGNPAYQLLKARFLSCFTLPALLATVQPITEKTVVHQANEEEEEKEEEEVAEMKKIKERVKQRRAEVRDLYCHVTSQELQPVTSQVLPTPSLPRLPGPDRTRLDMQKLDYERVVKTTGLII